MHRVTFRKNSPTMNRASDMNHTGSPWRSQALQWGVVAVASAVLLVLEVAAHDYSVLPADLAVTRLLQSDTNTQVFRFMTAVSWFGYAPQDVLVQLAICALLIAVKRKVEALFVLLSATADLLSLVLKYLVARVRPSANLVHVAVVLKSPSFPSGHTVHYTVLFGFLAYVLVRQFSPSPLRTMLITLCVALVSLIGISRIYLGEHWLTDVIGGYIFGALCLLALIRLYQRVLAARAHVSVARTGP